MNNNGTYDLRFANRDAGYRQSMGGTPTAWSGVGCRKNSSLPET
jgi:hypothetical protein